jgi:hypothetical protein
MTALRIALGVLLPIAASTAVLRASVPALWQQSRLLVVSLGAVVGLGCSSLLFASVLFTIGARWPLFVPLETAIWTVVLIASIRVARRTPILPIPRQRFTRLELATALIFSGTLAVSLTHFLAVTAAAPTGTWDAHAIWNMRARFIHRGVDGHWRDAFQAVLGWSHPNYPMMLPSSTARLWLYGQSESVIAPITLAFLFKFATVGVLVGALLAVGRRVEGLLAGSLLLASYVFNLCGVGQISDVPLAAFVLATTVLLVRAIDPGDESAAPAVTVLSFCAGCGAWTKNEGVVLVMATWATLALAVMGRRRRVVRTLIYSIGGVAFPVVVLLYFKRHLAPPSYLFESLELTNLPPQLWDLQRHNYILNSFIHQFWKWQTTAGVGVIPFVVLYGVAAGVLLGIRRTQLAAVLPVLAMLIGYYGAYVLTPLDLKWHIEFSLSRLLVHIWPSVIYLCFALPARAAPARLRPDTIAPA